MGFFDFVGRASKQLVSDLGGGLDLLSAGFQRPLQTVSGLITFQPERVKQVVAETKARPLKKQITSTLITTGLATATLLSGGAITKLIPKTILGKSLAVAGAGAVITSPTIAKVVEPTANVERLFTAGKVAGGIIEGKEKPQDVGTALKTGGLVGGGLIIGAGAILGGQALIEKGKSLTPETLIAPVKQLITEKPVGIDGQVPITPETATITTGKTPSKRRRAKKTPSVRQSVRVNIINKPVATGIKISNKRYLNHELLC